MAFTNVFKDMSNKDVSNESPTVASQFSSFFASTNQFFSSVQSKREDLLSDLSTKFSSMKLPSSDTYNKSGEKDAEKTRANDSDEEGSSASEYGDNGDQPMYADEAPEERRLSSESIDSLSETEANIYRRDIKEFVRALLSASTSDVELEGNEGKMKNYVTHHTGRSAFAKELTNQTEIIKEVSISVMQRLGKHCSLVLQQCSANDDFAPASTLLSIAFRIFTQRVEEGGRIVQTFLFTGLRNLTIWQSMRFWNAAIFIAIQKDRSVRKSTPKVSEIDFSTQEEVNDNITFNQLSKFVWRIYSLGLSKEICLEFLRKQLAETPLSKKKQRFLRSNVDKFYSE